MTPLVSWSLKVTVSIYFYWCALDLFFFLSLLFGFFYARCLIKQLQKSKVCLSLSLLPFASLGLFFLLLVVILLSFSVSLCVHAQRRLKEAPEQKVWVFVNKNERVCLRASLSLFASVCH